MTSSGVRLRNIRKRYRQGPRIAIALDGASIDAPECAVTVLYGPVGSGKTTLLNIVAGLEEPDEGEVWVHGVPMHRLGRVERARVRRRLIAYAPQIPLVFPWLSVEENILFASRLRGIRVDEGRVRELLETLGLLELRRVKAARLSGGQLRLLTIAMALVHERPVLLLDEPTAFLDRDTAERLWSHLLGLRRAPEGCRTLLVASHDELVRRGADRVYLLREGKTVEPTSASV